MRIAHMVEAGAQLGAGAGPVEALRAVTTSAARTISAITTSAAARMGAVAGVAGVPQEEIRSTSRPLVGVTVIHDIHSI